MKILVGEKGNVDFDQPVKMTKEQQNDFIKFMKTIFKPVHPMETDKFRKFRIGDQYFPRKWNDSEERSMLLDINVDTDKLCELLGRTWMGVNIKRGDFIPDLLVWADSKGYNIFKGDRKKIIEEYLEEKRNLVNEKRAHRSSRQKKINELITEINNNYRFIDSVNLRNRVGLSSEKDDEIIERKKTEIESIENELLEKYNTELVEYDED
ncbi:MAG: hypothetical protein KAT05_02910 [Spirochaetes bacterium]|nr:hypothetical protein [Spirochaetota bacterium]